MQFYKRSEGPERFKTERKVNEFSGRNTREGTGVNFSPGNLHNAEKAESLKLLTLNEHFTFWFFIDSLT